MAVCFINAHDGNRALDTFIIDIRHCGPEENLIASSMDSWVDYLGYLEAFCQKTDAPINLAQSLFAIKIVPVF